MSEVSDKDERSIEDGIVELDDTLRERTAALKFERERAKAAHPDFLHGAANAITSKHRVSVVDLEDARERRQKA
jgi:hypothetical protein